VAKQPVRTPRIAEKKGVKRHLLVDGAGIPLSLWVSGANIHDVCGLQPTLAARLVQCPDPALVRHLCADRGYEGGKALLIIEMHGYIPHVRSRKDEINEKRNHPDGKPRRWVVEVTHSWFNRFRKILTRFEKTLQSHYALLCFAAAVICWRKVISR
jgi:transposase